MVSADFEPAVVQGKGRSPCITCQRHSISQYTVIVYTLRVVVKQPFKGRDDKIRPAVLITVIAKSGLKVLTSWKQHTWLNDCSLFFCVMHPSNSWLILVGSQLLNGWRGNSSTKFAPIVPDILREWLQHLHSLWKLYQARTAEHYSLPRICTSHNENVND